MTVQRTPVLDDVCTLLTGATVRPAAFLVSAEEHPPADYLALRRTVFVDRFGLFDRDDTDDHDRSPHTVTLVARAADGTVLGGVRLHAPTGDPALGWWRGGRLAVREDAPAGVGSALVRAACATAESLGALRFDAQIVPANRAFFERLGWTVLGSVTAHGREHLHVDWPVARVRALIEATKAPLAALLDPLRAAGGLGGPGFVGDDAAPVGDTVFASVDAIVPAMVERDPEWAGWCGVLVGAGDLAAMGALGTGLLDALGSPDATHAARVLAGLRRGSDAFGLPVLGGHTQLGVPPALSVTAFGRTARPVRGGGGRTGDTVTLTADLGGAWRPGHTGRQWDSSTGRTRDQIAAMTSVVARTQPHAAKDVSMAGVIGTLGMLAEASGTGAVLDVAATPRPASALAGDWLTCFPGFGMLTTDEAGRGVAPAGPAVSVACGELTAAPGVRLRWPDGVVTVAVPGGVTGLGAAA
ncbi:MSMEG_0567/sll0787 family protein [Jatrophihabitans sp. YIM 134969]